MLYDITRHLESFRRQCEQFEQITADTRGLVSNHASSQALVDCNQKFSRSLYEKKLMAYIENTRDK